MCDIEGCGVEGQASKRHRMGQEETSVALPQLYGNRDKSGQEHSIE